MKKKYSRFRELWAVPKYQTLFKLGGYILFFIIFFAIASLGSNDKSLENKKELSTSYSTMKKNLKDANVSIKYEINSTNNYYLEGTIVGNVLSSTLEYNDEIKKVKVREDNVYLIQKDIEELDNLLLSDINLIYLFPNNIIEILNDNTSLMKQADNHKMYSYNIDNKSYLVYVNEKEIEQIIISDGMISYSLKYSIID